MVAALNVPRNANRLRARGPAAGLFALSPCREPSDVGFYVTLAFVLATSLGGLLQR